MFSKTELLSNKNAERYFNVLFFLFLFSIPWLMYFQLFMKDMIFLDAGDGTAFLAGRIFINDVIQNGELPLWNKYLANGIPYAGDLFGVYSPVGLLLSFLSPLWYIYSYYGMHIAIGGFFTYLYLKELHCDKKIAVMTGLLYALSIHLGGFRKSHMVIISVIVFLPAIVYSLEKYFNTERRKWLCAAGLFMAAQFFGGHVQITFYTDVAVMFFFFLTGFGRKKKLGRLICDYLLLNLIYLALISVQLVPTLELLREYSKSGTSTTSFEVFTSWSISFNKLIMMLFPNFWGNDIFMPGGNLVSSEMDIELFLGSMVLVVIVFGLISFIKKDSQIRLCTGMMSGAYIFAALAHIPLLNKILFTIPVINGFRCPARCLFIFIFWGFTLFGLTLNKIYRDNQWSSFARFVLIGALSALALAGWLALFAGYNENIAGIQLKNLAIDRFSKSLLSLLIFTFIIYAFTQLTQVSIFKVNVLLFLIFLSVLGETLPFTYMHSATKLSALITPSILATKVKTDIAHNKVWDAFRGIDGGHRSFISQNASMALQIPSINSYIAFNNPRLFRLFSGDRQAPFNFSGLMTGSLYAQTNVLNQNDLLSMLGIKYVIDSNKIIQNDKIIKDLKEIEAVFSSTEPIIFSDESPAYLYDKATHLFCYSAEVKLLPQSYYRIDIDVTPESDGQMLHVDFYGGVAYDHAEQEAPVSLRGNGGVQSIYLNSGQCDIAPATYARIIGITEKRIKVRSIKLTLLEAPRSAETIDSSDEVYVPYDLALDSPIYENLNARDILYTPEKITQIENTEQIYLKPIDLSLDKINYITNHKAVDVLPSTKIELDYFKNNSIKAHVSAKGPSFLNFSQNYYPGWKAYVNGTEVPVYLVNGLIQGIDIPEGDSVVEFKFLPLSTTIGSIISGVSLFLVVVYLFSCRPTLTKRRKSI